MGAAINVFHDSKAIIVNRDRFAPVKTTNDLLAIWSDAYELTEDFQLKLVSEYNKVPHIELTEKYYKNIGDFENYFAGVPSLIKCKNLTIEGEVNFGNNVAIIGDVAIKRDINLSDIVLENEEI